MNKARQHIYGSTLKRDITWIVLKAVLNPSRPTNQRLRFRHDGRDAARCAGGSSVSAETWYPHMPIGKMWIYRLLFVRFV